MYYVTADLLDSNGVYTEVFFEPTSENVTPLFEDFDSALACVKEFCSDIDNCVQFFEDYAEDSENITNNCSIRFRIYEKDIAEAITRYGVNNSCEFSIEIDEDIDSLGYLDYSFSTAIVGKITNIFY